MASPTNPRRDRSGPPNLPPDPSRSVTGLAEQALLGTALYAPPAARNVLGDLEAADLAAPAHRAVLAALRAVLADGADPEPALVVAAYNRGEHDNVRVDRFDLTVFECLRQASVPAAAPHLRRAVLEARWRRDAIAASQRIHQAAETAPLTDLHTVLAETLRSLGATLARLTPRLGPPRRGRDIPPQRQIGEAA